MLACLLAGFGWTQSPGLTQRIQELLPPDARIIETADLAASAHRSRVLVLWMSNPKRVVRKGVMTGPDFVFGDYWLGSAYLSLVDSRETKLINTVNIKPYFRTSDRGDFRIPFMVSNYYYHVPRPNSKNEGTPQILFLHDFTGEGVAGQFVLFDYFHTGDGNPTSVYGYSPKLDRAVAYQVERTEGSHRPELVSWVPQVFSTKPTRPGHWKFTWEAGHGDEFWIHEDVSFDMDRQRFVERVALTPYPGVGEASCDLDRSRLSKLLQGLKALIEDGYTDNEIQDLERMADSLKPGDHIDDPMTLKSQGKQNDVLVDIKKYSDGGLAISFITSKEFAAKIQATMDDLEH